MSDKELIKADGSILDLETKEFHTPTEERIELANHLHQQAIMGTFITALSIKRIFDAKLYLDLGCSSRNEYIGRMLPFGERQTYKYLSIAEKFSGFLESSGSEVPALESGFSMRKLYELSRLEEPDIKALMEGKEIEAGDDSVSIDDLREASTKEFTHRLKEVRKKYQGRVAQLEEENKTLKAEAAANEEKVEKAEVDLIQAQEIERSLGPVASLMNDKRSRIGQARNSLSDVAMCLVNANVSINDPQTLKEELLELISKINETHERLLDNYHELVADSQGLVPND